MNVLTLATLREFWQRYPEAEEPLRRWLGIVRGATYASFAEVKAAFGDADWVSGFIVFDIGGNKFRLIVRPNFEGQRFKIVFVGTHTQYDDWRSR